MVTETSLPSFVDMPPVIELNLTEAMFVVVAKDEEDPTATITVMTDTSLPSADYTFGNNIMKNLIFHISIANM